MYHSLASAFYCAGQSEGLAIRSFAHARTALKVGLDALGLEPGDGVLLPEHICEVVLHPLAQRGLAHRFYCQGEDLTPDWSALEASLQPRDRALLMLHYFGQPQDIARFRAFCDAHDLFLIEDNAHGHGGEVEAGMLGSFGDVGIASPRKILETAAGGLLWLRGVPTPAPRDLPRFPAGRIDSFRRSLVRRFPRPHQLLKRALRSRPRYEDPGAGRETPVSDLASDAVSQAILDQTDWAAMRDLRQARHRAWQRYAEVRGLVSLYPELHRGANPWCFAAYASDAAEARDWCEWGWAQGFPIFHWPALPEAIVRQGGPPLERWHRLLAFSLNAGPPGGPGPRPVRHQSARTKTA
ncbi:MAG: DegT/DnrJ/EryC1/StrS family aminotransferase [Myxococcota bacterium]